MDVTTVLAVICSAIVFLSWFVLPHGAPAATMEQPDKETSERVWRQSARPNLPRQGSF